MDGPPVLPDSLPPELPDEPPPPLPTGVPPSSTGSGSSGSSGSIKLSGGKALLSVPGSSLSSDRSKMSSAGDKYRLASSRSAGRLTSQSNSSSSTSTSSSSSSTGSSALPKDTNAASSGARQSSVRQLSSSRSSSSVSKAGAASTAKDQQPAGKSADPNSSTASSSGLKVGSLRKLSVPSSKTAALAAASSPSDGRRSSGTPPTSPLTLRKPTSTLATSPSLARSSRMQTGARRSIVRPPGAEPTDKPDSGKATAAAAGADSKSPQQQPAAAAAPEDDGNYNTSLTGLRDSITRQRAGSVKGSSGPLTATARYRAQRAKQMKRQSSEDKVDKPSAAAAAATTSASSTNTISPIPGGAGDETQAPKRDRSGSGGRLLDDMRSRSGSSGAMLEDARQRIRGRLSRSSSTELLDAPDTAPETEPPAARSVSPSIVATAPKSSSVLLSVAKGSGAASGSSSPIITLTPSKDDRPKLGLRKSLLTSSQTQLKDTTLSAIASAPIRDKPSSSVVGRDSSPARTTRMPSVERPPPLDDSPKKPLTLGERRQRIADAKAAHKRESTVSSGSLGLVSPLSSISRISDLSVSALMAELDRTDDEDSDNDDDDDEAPPSVPPDSPPPIPSEAPPPVPDSEPSTPMTDAPPAVPGEPPGMPPSQAAESILMKGEEPALPVGAAPLPSSTEPPSKAAAEESVPASANTTLKPMTPTIVSKSSPKPSLFESSRKSPSMTSSMFTSRRRPSGGSLFTSSPTTTTKAEQTAEATASPDPTPASGGSEPQPAEAKQSSVSRFRVASKPGPDLPDSAPPPLPTSSAPPDVSGVRVVTVVTDNQQQSVRKTTVVKKKRYVASKREGGSRPLHESDLLSPSSMRSADSCESLDWDRKSMRSMSVSSKVSDAVSIGTDFSMDSPLVSTRGGLTEKSPTPPEPRASPPRQPSEKSSHSQTSSGVQATAAMQQAPARNDPTRRSYSRAEREEARERFVQAYKQDSSSSSNSKMPIVTSTPVTQSQPGDRSSTATHSQPGDRSSMRPLSSTAVGLGGTDMLESLLGDLDIDTKRLLSGEQAPPPPAPPQESTPAPAGKTTAPATGPAPATNPSATSRHSTSSRDDGSPTALVKTGSGRRSLPRRALTPQHSVVSVSKAEVISFPVKTDVDTPELQSKRPREPTKQDMETPPPPPASSPPPAPSDPQQRFQRSATIDSGALGQLLNMQNQRQQQRDDKKHTPFLSDTPARPSKIAMATRQSSRRSTMPVSMWSPDTEEDVTRRSGLFDWTKDDVGDWLSSQGFSELVPVFQDQKVTGKKLAGITATQLKTMGLDNCDRQLELIAHRNTLLEGDDQLLTIPGVSDLPGENVPPWEREGDNNRRAQRRLSEMDDQDNQRKSLLGQRSSSFSAGGPDMRAGFTDSRWQSQDTEISAQLAQLRERQKLTDQLLGSREDLFEGIQRGDSTSSLRRQQSLKREQESPSSVKVRSRLASCDVQADGSDRPVSGLSKHRTSAASLIERRVSIRMKPITTWSESELAVYLCDRGISLSVTDKLRALDVDGTRLAGMTSEDLAAININGKEAEMLLAEVDQLRQLRRLSRQSNNPAAASTPTSASFVEEDGAFKGDTDDSDDDYDDEDVVILPAITMTTTDMTDTLPPHLSPGGTGVRLSDIPEASLIRGQTLVPPPGDGGESTQPSESESDAETVTNRLPHLRSQQASQTSFSNVAPPDLFRTLSRNVKLSRSGSAVGSSQTSSEVDYAPTPQVSLPRGLEYWTHSEVCQWLEKRSLNKYRTKAREIMLNGKHLAKLDLDVLDRLGVETDDEREAFLAAVYQASSNTNATDTVKALLRLSDGENREKLAAMLDVLQSPSPSSTVADVSTYLSGQLLDLLWPLGEETPLNGAQAPGQGDVPDNLASTGRPLVLEIQDAKSRHSAKLKYDKPPKKNKKRGVSFTDDDMPTNRTRHKDFEGSRSKSMGKGPFKSKLSRWFGEGDHHYAIKASSFGDTHELVEGNVKVYLRNLQPDTEYKAFHVSATTTAFQLIEMVLERMSIVEDPQRYRLVETSLRHGVADRDVASFECPLLIQSLWHSDHEFHFGLRGQPVGTIKIQVGLRGAKRADVTLQISPFTSAHQVVKLVLRKLNVSVGQVEAYCLTQEVPDDGESVLSDGEYPLLCSVACGHKNALWLRPRPVGSSRSSHSRLPPSRQNSVSECSGVDLHNAYSLLQSQAVRQRLESERERLILEEEIRRLQENTSTAASPVKRQSLSPSDMKSLEKIAQITIQLQIYATRLKETTVHAEQLASAEGKAGKEVLVLSERLSTLESQQKDRTTQLYKVLEEKEMLTEQLSTKENTIAYLRRENEILSADNKVARDTGVNPVNRELEDQLTALRKEKDEKENDVVQLKEELGQQARRLFVRDRRKSDVAPAKVEARPIFLAQLAEEACEDQHLRLVSVEINLRASKDPGWILSPTSVNETTQVTIMALQAGGPAQKTGKLLVGDSIVEINNQPITKEEDIAVAVKLRREATIVVARIAENQTAAPAPPIREPKPHLAREDVEAAVANATKAMRSEHTDEVESLHVLMQTLEAQVQEREKECQSLQERVEKLQQELEESETSSEVVTRLEVQAHDLRQQLESSELAREQLRSSLTNLTPHSSMQNIPMATLDQDLSSIRKKLVMSEEERSVLRSAVAEKEARIADMTEDMQKKEAQLLALRRERDSAIRSFRDSVDLSDKEETAAATGKKAKLLKSGSHDDILEALREKEEEANRGRVYVDKLLTLVIDEAPQLLGQISKLSQDQAPSSAKPQQDEWY